MQWFAVRSVMPAWATTVFSV